MQAILVFIALTATAAMGPEDAPPAWMTSKHPSDVAKSHVEEVTDAPHRFTVRQGGTMDGSNCRSPMGCGIAREGALVQTWESNRSVRMENVGRPDLVNPWLSNGRNGFRNVDEIVASAIVPGMTEAEKAFAIWFQEIRYRHHSPGDNNELGDAVKVFNVYGYNTCGNDSICMAALWSKAGLKVAPARALGHCISQAFYDGGWHFYDGDMHSVYLLRDNSTVAGEQEIVQDHDLIKRTHSKGILLRDTWWDGQGMCAMYSYAGAVSGERRGNVDTTMNMVLRPGEAIEWRWGHGTPLKHHGALYSMPAYPELICNGLWEYRPDFSRRVATGGRGGGEHQFRPGRTGSHGWAAGQHHLEHEEPLRLRGRPHRRRGHRHEVLHLGRWQDLAVRERQARQVVLDRRPGSLRVPAQVPARRRSAVAPSDDQQ